MNLKTIRIGLWGLVILVCLVGAGLYLAPRAPAKTSFGGGTYALVDENGKPVDQNMVIGQPSMLFFGYTHCPDVCPTTLADMASWFQALGPEGKNLKAFFVSVDPERDTPKVLKSYVSAVSDRITGITGTRPEINKIIKAYHIYTKKIPIGTDGDYSMDHTAVVFLLNSKGKYDDTIDYGATPSVALAKLRKLISTS